MQPKLSALTRLHRAALLGAGLCAALGSASGQPVTAPPQGASENYIDYSGGYSLQTGNRALYQKRLNLEKDGFGGIEDMRYSTSLGENTSFLFKGRALAGNNDYLIDLRLTKDEVGYLSAGYKEYRNWFDGSGGFFPPSNLLLSLFDNDLAVDRGNAWFEAGLTLPGYPSIVLRYDYLTREGRKDSTEWGDTTLTNGLGTRAVLPTFLQIDEKRHVVRLTVAKATEQTAWDLTARYEKNEQDNSRNIRRRAFESVDRSLTHKDGQDSDLTHLRGSIESWLNPNMLLTAAAAYTDIDATLHGSRIYGAGYDPVFDPLFARRQFHDEGFFDLHGSNQMKQSTALLNVQFVPSKNWVIIPGLRAEKITWDNVAEFIETGVGAGPAFVTAIEEAESESNKEWKDTTETIEVRYTGCPRSTLSLRGEWMQSDGNLEEDLGDPATGVVSIDRGTDFKRSLQKYSVTTNWYPTPGLSGGIQYYLKLRQNDYNSLHDSTPNTLTSSNRYPAYIADQDFETNDLNVRVSWRANPQVRFVTRYDYQESKIKSQEVGLGFGESGRLKSSIITESVSWNPRPSWFIQINASLVKDQLNTPATSLTGKAADLVQVSDNDYVNIGLNTGLVLDDRTDLYLDYTYYRADNFVDNSAKNLGFGAGATEHFASVVLVRRINERMVGTFKYGYADSSDDPSFGLKDYTAHLFYGKLQYRF